MFWVFSPFGFVVIIDFEQFLIHLIFFSRECLKLIPHEKFSFAKIWLLAAQFEIRQLNLKGARQILGNAIGKAPKDKVGVQTDAESFIN